MASQKNGREIVNYRIKELIYQDLKVAIGLLETKVGKPFLEVLLQMEKKMESILVAGKQTTSKKSGI